jgi:hypothetical protein
MLPEDGGAAAPREIEELRQYRPLDICRRFRAPHDPIEDIVIVELENALELVRLGRGEPGKVRFREALKNDVGFFEAAPLRAIGKAFQTIRHDWARYKPAWAFCHAPCLLTHGFDAETRIAGQVRADAPYRV